MTWEYLGTEEFDERYRRTAIALPETSEYDILDLNCGQAGLRWHITYHNYFANDLFVPDDLTDIWFSPIPDVDVDMPCDVLCCFGLTTGVVAKHELESDTASDSIVRLARQHVPTFIVLECIWACDEGLAELTKRLEQYYTIYEDRFDLGVTGKFYDKRHLVVLEVR